MSFDIQLQGFHSGEHRPEGLDLALAQLDPFVTRRQPAMDFLLLEYGDSRADVYVGEQSLMVNQVRGDGLWQVLLTAAHQADWVIWATACPVALTRPEQLAHLPTDLAATACLVEDGQGLAELFSR